VLGDDAGRAPAGLPARAAEALDLRPEASQRGERALEVAALLFLGLRERREVRVRMVADLVPGREDRVDRAGYRSAVQPGTKNVAGSEYSRSRSRMRGTPTSGP